MGSAARLGSSSEIKKKSDFSWLMKTVATGGQYWIEDRREREGSGIVWIDVGRSRWVKIWEERLDDEPVNDRNDSLLGVSAGELSDERSMNVDLASGE
jgi:hypothetical protein